MQCCQYAEIGGIWAAASHPLRVEGFIPEDGVICDLGECITKLDGLLFQIFTAMYYMPREVKSSTKLEMCGRKCVTGRLLGQKSAPALKSWL